MENADVLKIAECGIQIADRFRRVSLIAIRHSSNGILLFPLNQCLGIIAVHTRNKLDRNFFRANGFTRADIGTIAKTGFIHGLHHLEHPAISFDLSLWELTQMGNLGCHEQHGRGVLASGNAGSTSNTGGRVHGLFSGGSGHWNRVRFGRLTG